MGGAYGWGLQVLASIKNPLCDNLILVPNLSHLTNKNRFGQRTYFFGLVDFTGVSDRFRHNEDL